MKVCENPYCDRVILQKGRPAKYCKACAWMRKIGYQARMNRETKDGTKNNRKLSERQEKILFGTGTV